MIESVFVDESLLERALRMIQNMFVHEGLLEAPAILQALRSLHWQEQIQDLADRGGD